jgi:hypothetical protein
MHQASILFWLVFVALIEIKVACGCWCFETKLLGWMVPQKYIGQSCQTLGFV